MFGRGLTEICFKAKQQFKTFISLKEVITSMITTIIFDLDGVLIDSELYWQKDEMPFLKKLIPTWNSKHERKIIGMNVDNLYQYLVSEFKMKVSKKEFLKGYDQLALAIYQKKTQLLPNSIDLLQRLNQEKYTIAMASSSPRHWIDWLLERIDISKFFTLIISAEDSGGKGKPSPEIYLYTAKKLKKNPKECLAIEDSHNGVLAAKNAGMRCIGIRNGFNDDQNLSRCDMIISDFKELTIKKIQQF